MDVGGPAPTLLKFVCFHQNTMYISENQCWENMVTRTQSTRKVYTSTSIYVNKRLPKEQLRIKKHAQDEGLITTTFNCDVKVSLNENEQLIHRTLRPSNWMMT